MRLPRPEAHHAPEVYESILRECGRSATRLGEHLQACGWTLADAAWAAVNWDLPTLAAAVANERAKRNTKLNPRSETEFAKLKAEAEAAAKKKTIAGSRPKRTTRIVRSDAQAQATDTDRARARGGMI